VDEILNAFLQNRLSDSVFQMPGGRGGGGRSRYRRHEARVGKCVNKEVSAMTAQVDTDKCTGCGLCVEICPVEAIKISGGVAEVDEDICIGCCACEDECPNDAITVK